MTIEQILAQPNIDDIISCLKEKTNYVPEWSKLEEDYLPSKHQILTDSTLRPKEKRSKGGQREVPAKITYAAERNAVRKLTQMCFTIPVKREYQGIDDDKEMKAFAEAIEQVYKANRIDGVNMKRFKAFFACCEMCTIWYAVDTKVTHSNYGFDTSFKFRCKSFSPMPTGISNISQASLYPHFDDFGDLDAFSLEYINKIGGKSIKHFDVYTATGAYYYDDENGSISKVDQNNVPIEKIQLAYISTSIPIYGDVPNNRSEIEFTASRASDIIRKNSKPIVKMIGEAVGDAPVGDEAREVYRIKQGGDIGLIAPSFDIAASTSHIEQMKRNIEESTQMPNLSLENIKGLSSVVSGEARKTLLTDAHMKVGEEKHDIVWFLEREYSVIASLVAQANKAKWGKYVGKLKCKHIVTPFIQNDEASEISNRTKANGGLPIESHKESISRYGKGEDAETTLAEIRKEEKDRKSNEPTDVLGGNPSFR